MKVKKILVIDRKIDYHLMLKIIGPNQGIQYLGFKDSYDDKTICDYGTYFLDFAKNDYQKITKHERIIFREKIIFFSLGKVAKKISIS